MWTPPSSDTARSNSTSCRLSAARIASGACSRSAVLPSTSVRRKVIVPVGRLSISRSSQPVAQRVGGRLGTATDPDLLVRVGDVVLDGVRADHQSIGDLPGGAAGSDQL